VAGVVNGDSGFYFHWSESESAFNAELMIHAYDENGKLGKDRNFEVIVLVDKRYTSTFVSKSYAKAAGRYGEAYLQPGFRKKFLAESAAARKKFAGFFERVSKTNLREAGSAELASFLREYFELYNGPIVYFKRTNEEYTQRVYEELRNGLKRFFPEDEVDGATAALLVPIDLDAIKREEFDVARMALEALHEESEEKDARAARAIEEHALKHSILFYNSYDRAANHAFIGERVREFKKLGKTVLEKKIAGFAESAEKAGEKQNALLARIADERVREYALLLRDMSFERLELKDAWTGAEFRFLPLFEEIARRAGVPLQELMDVYGFEDAQKLLETGKKLADEEIARRREFYAFYLKNGAIAFESGDAAKALVARLLPQYFEELQGGESELREIKGVAASPGIARGKARVIRVIGVEQLVKDIREFQEGEVLVTAMTQPNMVVLARRAAAIVADEGGITSHAAVLAREFGIPCLVGCRKATRIVRTGDLVEVDAKQGVLRIRRTAK
jgi:phosphohistidine swiveling domain-containing protein